MAMRKMVCVWLDGSMTFVLIDVSYEMCNLAITIGGGGCR